MEFIEQNWMWMALAMASGGMLVWELTQGSTGISVSAATLMINREDALMLDVRETTEWSAGHIPNARHMAIALIDKHISEIEKFKNRAIIVCCASGNRSATACAQLKKAGFAKVFSLAGGMAAWQEAGLPVTTKS